MFTTRYIKVTSEHGPHSAVRARFDAKTMQQAMNKAVKWSKEDLRGYEGNQTRYIYDALGGMRGEVRLRDGKISIVKTK